jgi:hypothetical protein
LLLKTAFNVGQVQSNDDIVAHGHYNRFPLLAILLEQRYTMEPNPPISILIKQFNALHTNLDISVNPAFYSIIIEFLNYELAMILSYDTVAHNFVGDINPSYFSIYNKLKIIHENYSFTNKEYATIANLATNTDIINTAIQQTLSRTLITSFTTLLSVIILFFFGGEALRGFSFALLLGISFGTYSSICIAAPILIDLTKKQIKKRSNF